MSRYTAEQLTQLKQRWLGHLEALRKLIPVIQRDKSWPMSPEYELLIQALGPLPPGIEEVEADLRGAILDEVDLTGAHLERADLSGANLVETDLSGADLRDARLCGAALWNADLSNANLWEANLSAADLRYAKLVEANLSEANLTGANLWDVDLRGANLEKADLSGANVEGVLYTTDEIFDRLRYKVISLLLRRRQVRGTCFEHLDTTGVDFSKHALLKRYIEDYQFIQAFKRKNQAYRWILYPLWKGTSDCGRSLSIWTLWAITLIAGFGLLYACAFYPAEVPSFIQNLLGWAIPQMDVDAAKYHKGFWTPFYYSLATFTTSSFYGDVQLKDGAALFWNALEVVMGYLMLGGLISIFTNRLAQRS